MTISVECRTCGTKLRVKDEFAGKLVRCPECKMGISIPKPAVESTADAHSDLDLDLDGDLPPLPAPKRTKRPASHQDIDENLEFVDDEEVLPSLPLRKKKKKKVVEVDDEPVQTEGRGDFLVWVFLLALLPLAISVFLPELTLEQKIRKAVERDAELTAELDEYGPVEFLSMHDTMSLDSAHLSRKSAGHWLYALFATAGFLVLLNAMRSSTNVTPFALLLTGFLTATVGVAMLLAFQIIAELSIYIKFMGTGIGSLIIVFIKFIGFSYRSAFDPNSGFIASFIGFTCGVGFCEEVCKAAPVFFYLRNTRRSDWRGTCLLGFASGVGFGISEGIMYSASYYNGIEPAMTYVVRFASCVAFHAVLSGGVALLMFGNQDYLHGDCDWLPFFGGMVQYLFIAMILHGLYDTLLKQHLNAVGLLVALVSFAWLAWLSKYYWNFEPAPEPD